MTIPKTIGLRALISLTAFGGFCFFIMPSATAPFAALDVLKVILAGILYALSHGLRVAIPRLASVIFLALSVNRLLQLPASLWMLVPMALVALCVDRLPYPAEDQGGRDGKHDDVRPPTP